MHFVGGRMHAFPVFVLQVCGRLAKNPLGETGRWVMKAFLRRAYIGVHKERMVLETRKERRNVGSAGVQSTGLGGRTEDPDEA